MKMSKVTGLVFGLVIAAQSSFAATVTCVAQDPDSKFTSYGVVIFDHHAKIVQGSRIAKNLGSVVGEYSNVIANDDGNSVEYRSADGDFRLIDHKLTARFNSPGFDGTGVSDLTCN